jgi:DNA ligase-1|tara:strand:- start:3989 stop:5257 length:1269 start_codon:yes stop_codon:yes gene_type:complete
MTFQVIQKLESDNSSLFKQSVIKENLDNEEFILGAKMCLDPLVTFGVKQVPFSETDGEGLPWKEFEELAHALQTRQLTGHDARDAIQRDCDMATNEQWNDWYRRILIKDLRCGTGAKLINKVQADTIPLFGCMLAHDGAKHPKKIAGECYVEYKYDGVRVIAIVQNGSATLHSRNGKLLENFPHIEEALSIPEFEGLVFDGEVMSEDFQTLMKQVHRKEGAQTEDSYLAVFDMLTLDEFNAGGTSKNAIERRQRIVNLSDLFTYRIQLVDATLIDMDSDEGQVKFNNMNKLALDEGYEGLMIKPVSEGYKCKRSHAWLKIKPFIEVTLKVIDLEEGTGKNEGLLGALVVEGEDDGKFFQLNVGSGLTDENREQIWANKDSVIGQLVEIRADAATQSQDAEDTWSLRFPRFKTFRGFEIGEKI